MENVNRQITLAARPKGFPKESDFQLVSSPVGTPRDGECLVQVIYLSVDPYMRARLKDVKSYAPPVQVGQLMVGRVVGRVLASRHDGYQEGDVVFGDLGWQEYAVTTGQALVRIDPQAAPISTALGVLGGGRPDGVFRAARYMPAPVRGHRSSLGRSWCGRLDSGTDRED